MTIDIKSVAGTQRQSIARVELFTRAALSPDDWRMVIHFEDGIYDDNGELLGRSDFGTRRIVRRFGDIKNDVVATDSAKMSIAQIAELIRTAAYIYRQQDVDAKSGAQP